MRLFLSKPFAMALTLYPAISKMIPIILSLNPVILSASEGSPTTTIDFFAFGDLRGYLEPCGCDPKTDMGGVKRIASFLEQEQAFFKSHQQGQNKNENISEACVFHLGNLLDLAPDGTAAAELTPSQAARKDALEKSLNLLKPHASLYNISELKYDLPRQDFHVLNNLSQNPTKEKKILCSGQDLSVYGFVSPTFLNQKSKLQNIESFLKTLKASKSSSELTRVLLFSGKDQELKKALSSGLFSEIISSNKAAFDHIIDDSERQNEGRLARRIQITYPEQPQQKQEKLVYMVPLGGQGILRGGNLSYKKPPTVDLLMKSKTNSFSPSPPTIETPSIVTWLLPTYTDSFSLKPIFDAYEKSIRQTAEPLKGEKLKKHLTQTPFAGSQSCQTCHTQAYETWKSSAHAHAFATLKSKNKDWDPQCVSCHVLGYSRNSNEEGKGFHSEQATPQFANVQCENCHGPAKEHMGNPINIKPPKSLKSLEAKKSLCQTCHHPPHTSEFDFEKYWEKVRH